MRKKSASGVNENQKSGRQFAYHRGSQRDGSPDYVLLYSEDEKSEDEEQFPLKTRKPRNVLPCQVQVINVQIQSEDTLQAIALRYRCTVSELKRINNIHKENEIYAHRFIKVPVKPFSLLSETIGPSTEHSQSDQQNIVSNDQMEETLSKGNEIINLLSIPTPLTSSLVEINNIILNSTVEPLSQFNHESSELIENIETEQLLSSVEHIKTNSSNNFVNTFKCSGADWGLSWYQLLCFSLLLGFAGPIIYVLYVAEPSKHSSS